MQRFIMRLSETQGPGHPNWPSVLDSLILINTELEQCWKLTYKDKPFNTEVLLPLIELLLPALDQPLYDKLHQLFSQLPESCFAGLGGFCLTNLIAALQAKKMQSENKVDEQLPRVIQLFQHRDRLTLLFCQQHLTLLKNHYLAILAVKIKSVNVKMHTLLFSNTMPNLDEVGFLLHRIKEYLQDRVLENSLNLRLMLDKLDITIKLLKTLQLDENTKSHFTDRVNENWPTLAKPFRPGSLSMLENISAYLPTFTRTLTIWQETEKKLLADFINLLDKMSPKHSLAQP